MGEGRYANLGRSFGIASLCLQAQERTYVPCGAGIVLKFGLDAGVLHDFSPFRDFSRNEPGEFARRAADNV